MDTCGRCTDCAPHWVWNPFERHRVLMCTKRVAALAPFCGTPTDITLVLDPASRLGVFFGRYCGACEGEISGGASPGLDLGPVALCRTCAHELDEAVFAEGQAVVSGVTVEARSWAVLRLQTDLGVRGVRHELDHALRRNLEIVEELFERFQELTLYGDVD